MTDKRTPIDPVEELLESHFKRERENAPAMDDAFLERMTASAAHMSPAKPVPQMESPTLLQRFGDALGTFGGWRGASVLTASAILGVTFGYAGPESVSNLPVLSQLSETLVFDLDGAIDDFDSGVFDLVLVEG